MSGSPLDKRQGTCRKSDGALEIREWQRGDYEALHTMYTDFIDALKGAIDALEGTSLDNHQTKSAVLKVQAMCSTGICPKTLEQKINAFLLDKAPTSHCTINDMFRFELKEVHTQIKAQLDFLCEQEQIRIDQFINDRQALDENDTTPNGL